MTTFKLKNFRKNNTPRWAEGIGNSALILGGIFSAIAASTACLESLPPSMLSIPVVVKIITYGKNIGVIGALICGGVKSLSQLFGIPLKDIQ